ncbi:hypothetical protein DM860_007917 [Cuscuta australis]|uniref:Uncharacterized protein n=1 Tax=Cuscuta australis TaxID=267555 RepID=A0A328E1B7_9ASTE|nr:hypothetical protein DM860_007917 [Cuscuta australis]
MFLETLVLFFGVNPEQVNLLFHRILPRHFFPIHNGHRQQATKKPDRERPTNRTVFCGILDEPTVMYLEKRLDVEGSVYSRIWCSVFFSLFALSVSSTSCSNFLR